MLPNKCAIYAATFKVEAHARCGIPASVDTGDLALASLSLWGKDEYTYLGGRSDPLRPDLQCRKLYRRPGGQRL